MKKFLPFRENKKIGILVDDFRIMYEIAEELKSWGFNFELLKSDEPIPQDLSIILGSPGAIESKLSEKKIQFIEISGEIKDLITSLILHIVEKKLFEQVVIGIDPGASTGLAVIADDCLLFAEVVSEDELVQRTLDLLNQFPAKRQIIKIGDGGVISGQFFMNLLSQIPQHVVVQKVDESKSSFQLLSGPIVLDKNQGAAIRIARRKGMHIKFPPKINISAGMVGEVQNQSRKLSGGLFTIPRSLAIRVCRGELTIREAVNEYKHLLNL